MHDTNDSSDSSTVTRRRVLATGASIIGAGSVGVYGVTRTENARASVDVESFQVSDVTFEAQSVTPVLDATIAYDYSVKNASEIFIGLEAGGEQIASETLRTDSSELQNTTELSGNVLDSPAFDQSDFAVASGEETTVSVDVSVVFEVRYDSNVVASDSASDTASVEVLSPESGAYATVGGSASFRDGSE